jgi:hypothetical protein
VAHFLKEGGVIQLLLLLANHLAQLLQGLVAAFAPQRAGAGAVHPAMEGKPLQRVLSGFQ